MDKGIWEGLQIYGLPSILVIVIAIALWKPENIKLWASWFWYFISKVIAKTFRRKAIALGVESRCTSAIKKISKESPDLNLPDIAIQWATENNIETFLREGKAIVKLNFSKNLSKNIVVATSEYVRNAVLIKTKTYLDNSLKFAIDFSVTKKILLSIKKYQKDYVSLFLKENPLTDPLVRQKCTVLEEIDDTGFFTRIVLKELDSLGDKLAGRLPNPDYNHEAHQLINFIHSIAIRETEEQTNLLFENRHINIAVILVAKAETFVKHGIDAYLRRIKLCLSKGVEDYYLLARNEKVDILKEVAKQLLDTGYFIQEHKPQEYKDIFKRDVICYYFKINKDSLLVQSTQKIKDAKENDQTLSGIITKITSDFLKVDVDTIEGIVYKENVSTIPIENLKDYFEIDELLELKPYRILEDGTHEFIIKETKSDPNILLQEQLSLGKEVKGIVSYVDDDFLIVDLANFKINGISFRNGLTFSRYVFLHQKFKQNDELNFKVVGYDYSRARVKLEAINLIDPWSECFLKSGDLVDFTVMQKISKGFVGEIVEGLEAILYENELSWFANEIDVEKSKIKLSDTFKCRVLKVDRERRIVILSRKISESPLENFFNSNRNTILDFIIATVNEYGVTGYINNKWQIYVPKYLQSWDKSNFQYIVGKNYKVCLKALHDNKEKIIGSFREVLPHPLEQFKQKYPEGSILGQCKIASSHEWGYLLNIRVGVKLFETCLLKGEITDKCYLNSLEGIFKSGDLIPLVVKKIDFDKSRILMSLKDLFFQNLYKLNDLDYENTYNARIISNKGKDYVVILKGFWLDAILETKRIYKVGEELEVWPLKIDNNLLVTDE